LGAARKRQLPTIGIQNGWVGVDCWLIFYFDCWVGKSDGRKFIF
jgi:hypothetical protein